MVDHEEFYRVGKAARSFGVTRQLICELAQIEGFAIRLTENGHYLIPKSHLVALLAGQSAEKIAAASLKRREAMLRAAANTNPLDENAGLSPNTA